MNWTNLRGLVEYGDLFSRRVFLAIYWSVWRRWTLHGVAELLDLRSKDKLVLSFGKAFQLSDMRLLGDALLGTTFPLKLRFGVTSQLRERHGSESKHLVRIESAEISADGKPITNKRDKQIAFGFMMHGGWEETERVEMDGDQIVAIEYSYSPHGDPEDNLGFAPVTALSSLASSQFNDLTADSDSVDRLRPQDLPSPPYPRVGEGYYGVDLPLWVLVLEPDRPKAEGSKAIKRKRRSKGRRKE